MMRFNLSVSSSILLSVSVSPCLRVSVANCFDLVELVEHEVDDHAGHRNIQPDRQCPSRNLSVKIESLLQRAGKCHEDHGHDYNSQNRVRDQDEEIDWANDSFPLEPSRAQLLAEVIDQI